MDGASLSIYGLFGTAPRQVLSYHEQVGSMSVRFLSTSLSAGLDDAIGRR